MAWRPAPAPELKTLSLFKNLKVLYTVFVPGRPQRSQNGTVSFSCIVPRSAIGRQASRKLAQLGIDENLISSTITPIATTGFAAAPELGKPLER